MKSCKKKFEMEQKQLPKELRRSLPDQPVSFEEMKIKGMNEADMEKFNNEAFKNFNEKALVPCEN